jgi:hypothetical protein
MNGAAFAPGKVGQAFSFDGVDDLDSLPDDLIRSRNYLTLDAWFKTSAPGVLIGNQSTSYPLIPTYHTPILYVGLDGRLRGEFWQGAIAPITTAGPVSDGTWHHVALTGNGNTQSLYLDGALVGTLGGVIAQTGLTKNQIGIGDADFWPSAEGTGYWFGFNGLIDEVDLLDRALTAGEVYAIYYAGPVGKCTPTPTPTPTATLASFTFSLAPDGLSDIGVPLAEPQGADLAITDAESLALAIETQGGVPFGAVQQALKWDASSQNFLAWSHEFGFGDNFALSTGDAVLLVMNGGPSSFTFTGRVPQAGEVSFNLTPGQSSTNCALNFLSLPFDQAQITTADALSDAIGMPDLTVTQVLDWESSLQNFYAWSNEFGFGDDFPTTVGYPYMLCLSDTGVPPTWP